MASLYKRNNSKIWWIRFQHQGKRIQKSTGTKDKSEALKLLVQCQEDVRRYNIDATIRHRFQDMSQKFADEHLPLLKPLTAEGYRTHIKYLTNQFHGLYLDEINKTRIAEYISARRQAGLTSPTIRRHLSTLSSMYSRAIGWGWIETNPSKSFDKRAVPEAKPRVRYITQKEFQRLHSNAAPHLKPILEIAVQTGMRSEEILSLKWSQINLDRREITLTKTKSGLPRVIPMTDQAVTTFVATLRHVTSPYVFCNRTTGERYRSVKKAFHSACRRSQITDFRFHDLRHTFASWSVQGGMDLYRLSRILGHATTQMTARYAHLATADLHAAVRSVATFMATGT